MGVSLSNSISTLLEAIPTAMIGWLQKRQVLPYIHAFAGKPNTCIPNY